MKNSITINYNDCAVAKISQKIHHEFRFNEKNSKKCLAIDFHDFKQNAKDFIFLTIITNCWSDFIWDFYLSSCTAELVIKLLMFFFDFLKWQYRIEFKMMKMNKKLYTQKLKIKKISWTATKNKNQVFFALYSNSQWQWWMLRNVIKQKIIVMKNSFNLLKKL